PPAHESGNPVHEGGGAAVLRPLTSPKPWARQSGESQATGSHDVPNRLRSNGDINLGVKPVSHEHKRHTKVSVARSVCGATSRKRTRGACPIRAERVFCETERRSGAVTLRRGAPLDGRAALQRSLPATRGKSAPRPRWRHPSQ